MLDVQGTTVCWCGTNQKDMGRTINNKTCSFMSAKYNDICVYAWIFTPNVARKHTTKLVY